MATKPGHHYGGAKIEDGAYKQLQELRCMSLEAKVERSLNVISCWYEAWDGKVAVSYSGGKDSSVVLHLVRSLFPDVPAVFCNTGLEYPEVVRAVKATPGSVLLRPAMPFHHVVSTYGWPLISKRVARGVNILRNPTGANANIWKLYDEGVNRFGEPVQGFKVPARWRCLVNAPFNVSDRCCQVMKKDPMHRYQRETGRMPYIGLLATDSKAREKNYLQHSCNAYDIKNPRSAPLGFWTEQDVLKYIASRNLKIPSVYGQIVRDENGQLRTTGVSRTGCVFCGFGLHLDERPTRFQRLATTHPRLWDYVMNRLGMNDVLAYLRREAADTVAWRFNPEAVAMPCREHQLSFVEAEEAEAVA